MSSLVESLLRLSARRLGMGFGGQSGVFKSDFFTELNGTRCFLNFSLSARFDVVGDLDNRVYCPGYINLSSVKESGNWVRSM
jgi:hypothetical protein